MAVWVENGRVPQTERLRIAQVAPLSVTVPPHRYGGTERVVHYLTEGLVQRGHEVTLFAAGGSLTSAHLRAVCPEPLWDMQGDGLAYQLLEVEDLVRSSASFDIIHSHIEGLAWPASDRLLAPLITTLHGRLDLPGLRPLFQAFRGQKLVSISDSQRAPLAGLDLAWLATVYNGLDLGSTFSLGRGDGGYLVFLGRIGPEKDPLTAIRVAIRAGLPLMIAARVDAIDREYHERCVVPYLDHPLIHWLGEIDDRSKAELLAGARALLMPIDWAEPFGLSFIEALAAGTPVISRPRGSLPELVKDGRHGFLAETEDELVTAVKRAGEIEREGCRRWALSRFSAECMVDGYEEVYRRLLVADTAPAALSSHR